MFLTHASAKALYVQGSPAAGRAPRRVLTPDRRITTCSVGSDGRGDDVNSDEKRAGGDKNSWLRALIGIFRPAEDHGVDWTATATPFGALTKVDRQQATTRSRGSGASRGVRGGSRAIADESFGKYLAKGAATLFTKPEDHGAFTGGTPTGFSGDVRSKAKAYRVRMSRLSKPNQDKP
jgi:hypothetical protein